MHRPAREWCMQSHVQLRLLICLSAREFGGVLAICDFCAEGEDLVLAREVAKLLVYSVTVF